MRNVLFMIRRLAGGGQAMCLLLLFSLSACAPTAGILGSSGNWQAGGPQHQHIRTLIVNPSNLNEVYAGDAQGGLFVSMDGGQHWTPRDTGLPMPDVIHDLTFNESGKILYAATEKGIFVSANDGQQWNALGSASSGLPSTVYTVLALGSDSSQLIYAGTTTQGVVVSTNGGKTWTSASKGISPGTSINDLIFDLDKQQLWAATSTGVYRSDDKGASWQAWNAGLSVNSIANTVRVASMSGGPKGLLYLGTTKGFFRSDDAGAHWASSPESLSSISILHILVDFRVTTGNALLIGTSVGAFRSDDGGEHWQGIAMGLPRGEPVYMLALGSENDAQLYAAADGVYQYPGTSGGAVSPWRIVYLALVGLLFFLLYRIVTRGRTHRRKRPVASKSSALVLSEDPTSLNGASPDPKSLPKN